MESAVGARSSFVEEGVHVATARLHGFAVSDLVFPPSHAHRVDPERPYLAIVLDGALEKTFAGGARTFAGGVALTMPAGAAHATRCARDPTRVLVVHPVDDEPWRHVFADVRESPAAADVARRLAVELRATDDAWLLAAESLCLGLLAGLVRGRRAIEAGNGAERWLEPVRDRLHESFGERLTLADLAATAGVHPVHLARAFRGRYGVSVGEYVRRRRLEWAAAELATSETPVAAIAAEAGFADQSHFTRAFRRSTGVTPGRYRRVVRGS